MERRSATLRGSLFNGTSRLGLGRARLVLVPMLTGAAIAMGGISFNPSPAAAAAVTCSPDIANGSAGLSTDEICAGPGTIIDYATTPATQNGSVILNTSTGSEVVISGGAGNGIQVDAGAHNVGISDTVLTTPGTASITGATNGILMTGTGGNVAVTLNNNSHGVAVTGLAGAGINLSEIGAGTISITTIGNVSGTTAGITTSAVSGTTAILQTGNST